MNSPLAFIVVEDRRNKALLLCRESAALAGEQLIVLSGTDAGPDYARFRDAYVHLSSNSPEFEMVCFRRYFLLAKYLAAHPECRRFVLIDSDVLLFRGVGAHIGRLAGAADFCGSCLRLRDGWDPCQISPHVSYWTSAGLLHFVAHVLDTYTTRGGLKKLREIAAQFAAKGVRGGVSDMTLLYLWAHATGNAAPINRVFDGGVIDHNINGGSNLLANEFRVRGGAKRIEEIDGHPCLTATATGEAIRVMALHFQGSAKMAMQPALHGHVRTMASLIYLMLMARIAKNHMFSITARARRAFDARRVASARAMK